MSRDTERPRTLKDSFITYISQEEEVHYVTELPLEAPDSVRRHEHKLRDTKGQSLY